MDKDKKLKPFEVRPYCNKQLMQFYDLKKYAFGVWVESLQKDLGKKLGRDYTPRQILIFLKNCGAPPGYYITPETQEAINQL
jgi:hypothetical protein